MDKDTPSMIHYPYHPSTVCGYTLRGSTHTTLRGCVLPCNHVEYYAIAAVTPTDPEQSII